VRTPGPTNILMPMPMHMPMPMPMPAIAHSVRISPNAFMVQVQQVRQVQQGQGKGQGKGQRQGQGQDRTIGEKQPPILSLPPPLLPCVPLESVTAPARVDAAAVDSLQFEEHHTGVARINWPFIFPCSGGGILR
jgi:hypothetical protein